MDKHCNNQSSHTAKRRVDNALPGRAFIRTKSRPVKVLAKGRCELRIEIEFDQVPSPRNLDH